MKLDGEREDRAANGRPAYEYPRLQGLYEAGKLLAEFTSPEQVLPALLDIVTATLPVASAVLMLQTADEPRSFSWSAEDLGKERLRLAEAHARATFEYLVPVPRGAPGVRPATSQIASERLAAMAKSSEPFVVLPIALPLVIKRDPIFGVFQLEPTAAAFQSDDLLFADALVTQLAIALARTRAQEAECSARLLAESATRRIRQLLRISDTLLEGPTLEEILPSLLASVRDAFATDAGVLFLLRPEDHALRLGAQVGLEGAAAAAATGRVAERIMAEGVPMIFDEVARVEEVRAVPRSAVRSLLGVPLRFRGRITGVLAVATFSPHEFADDDARLLEIISDRVALGIEHAQLFDAVARERGRLHCIAEASAAMSNVLDYGATVQAVLQWTVPALADVCLLDVFEEGGALRRAGIACSEPSKEEALRTALGTPPEESRDHPLWRVLRDGRTQERALPEGEGVLRELGVTSELVVPLTARGQVIGAMTLAAAPPRERGRSDVELAEEIGRRAALSIDNARLYASALRAVGTRELMTAVVSHDLKTPLTAIRMTADLLLRTPAHLPERRRAGRNQLESIRRRVDAMARMVQGLLDVSSIEAGKFSVNKTPVALRALTQDLFEDFGPRAEEKGLHLELSLPDEDLVVSCDRDRILQALSNLLSNAIKFTARGGRVSLRVAQIGGEVHFAVADTGCGIPAEAVPHVFDRYWQAEETARLGTGLGLSIAKGIVEAHGGRIWVESDVGVGTRFELAVPMGELRQVRS